MSCKFSWARADWFVPCHLNIHCTKFTPSTELRDSLFLTNTVGTCKGPVIFLAIQVYSKSWPQPVSHLFSTFSFNWKMSWNTEGKWPLFAYHDCPGLSPSPLEICKLLCRLRLSLQFQPRNCYQVNFAEFKLFNIFLSMNWSIGYRKMLQLIEVDNDKREIV